MTSWGEKTDRRNEEWNKAVAGGLKAAEASRRSGRRKPLSKKRANMECIGFCIILIIAIIFVVVLNLGLF